MPEISISLPQSRVFQGILLLVVLLTTIQYAAAQKEIRSFPDEYLGCAVLLTLEGGAQGTGFFLRSKTHIYLVTAKHVIYSDKKLKSAKANLLAYPGDYHDLGSTEIILDLDTLEKEGNTIAHPNADVAVIKIMRIRTEADTPKKIAGTTASLNGVTAIRTAGSVVVGLDLIKKFDKVLIGNAVVVFGYPVSIGLKQDPQFEYDKPLIRKGIISGKNAKSGTIILDAQIHQGNSGGPVIEIDLTDRGNYSMRVIGVVTQFIPFIDEWVNTRFRYGNQQISNSGYSIAVPMDRVLELIQD